MMLTLPMPRVFLTCMLLGGVMPVIGLAQEDQLSELIDLNSPPSFTESAPLWTSEEDFSHVDLASFFSDSLSTTEEVASLERRWEFTESTNRIDFPKVVYRGQSPGGSGSGGGGAGADAATDPSAPLVQLQIQNVFTPSTYDASGYAHTTIVQPVLPFPVTMPGLKKIFPVHIIRPTLPIIAQSANPNGPAGTESGLGDLTLLDAYVHPVEGFGTLMFGYNAIIPTSSNSQLGLGEWQLGPMAAVLYKEIPKTLLGVLITTQYSFESDAQMINVSPLLIKYLPDEWYVGWGEIFWTFDTENGNYNLPLQARVGKVVDLGGRKANIFVEPFYTPDGLRRGPAAEWGIKLSVALLYPEKKLKPLCGCLWRSKKNDSCDSCF